MLKQFKLKVLNIKSGLLLFSLIPTFILIFVISFAISRNQWQESLTLAENKFSKAVQEINVSLNQAINFSINTISNHYLVSLFEMNYESTDMNYQTFLSLDMFFTNYKEQSASAQRNIVIYHNNYSMYRNTFSKYIDTLDPVLLEQLKALSSSEMLWTEDEKNFNVYKAANSANLILISEYSIPKNKIDEIVNKFDVLKNNNAAEENTLLLSDVPQSGAYVFNKTLANGKHISLRVPASLKYHIYWENFFLFFVCSSFFALIIIIFSNLFTSRFKHKITVFIDRIASSENLTEIKQLSCIESDILSPVYKKILDLIESINELHSRNNRITAEKSMIELKYVQSQFNPHLLYNTLGVLKWKCLKYDTSLAKTIDSMADYYRACISCYDEVISFSDEIDLIKKYIELMEFIHTRSYPTHIHIDDALLTFQTPKHILQPFVENAILHGIQQKKEGYIKIDGDIVGDFVILKLFDNGNGIPPERLEKIKSANYFSKYKSYGIKNTAKRINLFYGDCSSLSIESEPGKSTLVTIKIPYHHQPETSS